MNIEESYNKKSEYYDNYRENAPGWNHINLFLNNKLDDNISILDVGCGTGVFLEKLQQYNYKELHGIDPSKSMIEKSYEKTKHIDNCKIWQDYIENIEDNSYDLIFCNQVIQNLTLNKKDALDNRNIFYENLYRVLKDKGKLIVTTRNIVNNYSDMYWYTDEDILKKSVDDMKNFVPTDLNYELENINKFKEIYNIETNDLIYKNKYYTDINSLNNDAWYAADSFWSHVQRNNEFNIFKNNIEILKKKNKLDDYINNRNKLRQNNSQIKICYCVK